MIIYFFFIGGMLLATLALVVPNEILLPIHPGALEPLRTQLADGGIALRVAWLCAGAMIAGLAGYASRISGRQLSPPAISEPRLAPADAAEWVALVAVVVGACLLRLHSLTSGLWYDEIMTFVYYGDLGIAEAMTTYNSQNQHFIYTLSWKLLLLVFDERAVALRLPAVGFGVASIVAVYLLAAQTIGRREGIAAAALMALSYHHVWFSQNARGYTALMFFGILASVLLVRAMRVPGPGRWAAYAASVALGAYTQPAMVFIAGGQFVTFLIHGTRARHGRPAQPFLGFVYGFVLSGVLTVALYAPVLPQFLATSARHGGLADQWTNPVWGLLELLRGMGVGGVGGAVLAVGGLVFAAGCLRLFARNAVLVELFFFPVLITLAATLATSHHVWPRLFVFSLGHALLIAVAGAMQIGDFGVRLLGAPRRLAPALGGLGVGAACAVFSLALPTAYLPKQDFEGALAYVRENLAPGDNVALLGITINPYMHYYPTGWPWTGTAAELDQVRRSADRTWVLYFFPEALRAGHPDVAATVEQDFVTVAEFGGTLGGGTIFVARADTPPG